MKCALFGSKRSKFSPLGQSGEADLETDKFAAIVVVLVVKPVGQGQSTPIVLWVVLGVQHKGVFRGHDCSIVRGERLCRKGRVEPVAPLFHNG
jgi:hypothetical protein